MATIDVATETAGIVSRIEQREGATVARDAPILFVEIMKMEIPVATPVAGTIVELLVAEGDSVAEGQRVAVIETP
jgi:acetyl-CoA carboxylase biotin carboxyl carrier protein